jgi:uncharacterized membrane protein
MSSLVAIVAWAGPAGWDPGHGFAIPLLAGTAGMFFDSLPGATLATSLAKLWQ